MSTHSDFEEFLRLLNKAKARFVVVGGYAVAFHGHVRATGDLDIFFEMTEGNRNAIREALIAFGFEESCVPSEVLAKPGNVVRIGNPPVRIELINRISGLSFEEVWQRRERGRYGQVEVGFISLDDLIRNKKAAGRPKDLLDVEELTAGG
jgi:predicted nucleotidyltransferase